jgi:hypothetical protein
MPYQISSFRHQNQLAGSVTCALFAAAVSFGFGKHSIYVSHASVHSILQCIFGLILTGLLASTFSRVSVAFLLLDFTPSRIWIIVVSSLIIFQIITLLAANLIELFQCRPVRAFWEDVLGEKCNTPSMMWTLVCVYTGSSAVSPLACKLHTLMQGFERDRNAG